MTHANFPFIAAFPSLVNADGTSPTIDTACSTVETEWSGIFTLYTTVSNGGAKQQLLEGYLVGWWLADLYPTALVGVSGDGGMPLTSKTIGGVSITRKDFQAQSGLKQLESNAFGVKALQMIMNAPERFMLYGQGQSIGPAFGTGLPSLQNNGV